MSKRYYVECPILAMYMMKYHNIQFVYDDGYDFADRWIQGDFPKDIVEFDSIYYIKKESEHLLQPQIGDILAHKRLGKSWLKCIENKRNNLIRFKRLNCYGEIGIKTKEEKRDFLKHFFVSRRNGKPTLFEFIKEEVKNE